MAKTLTKRDLVNKISAETNFTQIEVFDIVQRARGHYLQHPC